GSQTNRAWTVAPVSVADAGTYSVTITDACGSVSSSATLTVLTNVNSTPLASLTNCPGDTAVFTTTPSGSGPFSFVWRKNGSVVSGQTNNSLSFSPMVLTDSGTYSVTVIGACGTVISSASLTVLTNVGVTQLTN